jgi:hypothetical protein
VLGLYRGFFAGSRMCLATSDILPEAHASHATRLTVLPSTGATLAGWWSAWRAGSSRGSHRRGTAPVNGPGSDRSGVGVAQIWLDDIQVWEELFRRIDRDVEVDDRAVAGTPVGWRGERAGRVELKRAQDMRPRRWGW